MTVQLALASLPLGWRCSSFGLGCLLAEARLDRLRRMLVRDCERACERAPRSSSSEGFGRGAPLVGGGLPPCLLPSFVAIQRRPDREAWLNV